MPGLVADPNSSSLCGILFGDSILGKLGFGAFCKIGNDNKSIVIELGLLSTVLPGDSFTIKASVLKDKTCIA